MNTIFLLIDAIMPTGKDKGWLNDGTDQTEACYLGEFLRMDDPEMDKIPRGIVDLKLFENKS